ncbi:MAG: hypothetical protein GX135_00100 [Candidatus Cloacimonetes bacterium]|nr:hypothetical protein [Candidatus Cloacimonadota bacterium]MDX9950439.1 hypothetical protein [Candidatus Syntrophosphaera sp.]NLN84490.1 hypothetical protein [Candidatus Cloacimonadota bacterium]
MFQQAYSLLPTSTQTRSDPVILSVSDGLVGAPDSSGRRCQIHLAQCPFDHPDSAHPTQTQAWPSFRAEREIQSKEGKRLLMKTQLCSLG